MADLVALRTSLGRMGLSYEAALFLTDVQGMDTLTEFQFLNDDEVESLCRVLRRPGGTSGTPPVPHPGFAVSVRAELNLKMMCYLLRYRERTSRTVTAADITITSVRAVKVHREWENHHKDVDPPTLQTKDWPKMIEAIEEWLRGCLGTTKIPLAYVIRPTIEVIADGNDPATDYSSSVKELIARAPIKDADGTYVQDYLADREMVWDKLSSLLRGNDCFSYMRSGQKNTDGRMAFLGLKDHYLGPNNVDNMAASAERILATTAYHGETRRWTFEKYVKLHVDQHHILEGLKEHGHAGIDVRSKVRHLMDGIKTSAFESVKCHIMANALLRKDFDGCVNLYKDYIQQREARTPNRERDANISGIKTYSNTDNVKADMSIEDRYYDEQEYRELTSSQKKGLREKRKSRGNKPRPAKAKPGKNKSYKFSKREIKALVKETVSQQKVIEATDPDSDDNASPSKGGNRSNKALQRKKT